MKNLNPAFMKNGEASIAKVSLMMNHMSFHLYKNNQRGKATTVHVTKQKKIRSDQSKKITLSISQSKKFRVQDAFQIITVAPQALLCICCLFNNCWPFMDGLREA